MCAALPQPASKFIAIAGNGLKKVANKRKEKTIYRIDKSAWVSQIKSLTFHGGWAPKTHCLCLQ